MPCLDEEHLAALFARTFSDADLRAVEEHLDECPTCRALVADLLIARSHDSVEPDEELHTAGSGPSDQFETGDELQGRYVILKRIGMGSMGVVYAAYDTRLDRKVALKLLHRGRWTAADQFDGEARLLREAQTLGRLSHPNIVVVHDVGTVGVDVFMAMEFVDGQTLARWLTREPPPSPAQLVEMFLGAGLGLAAAHAAGVVHRDFKPDNVLVGADGRVRVTDFGLARQLSSGQDLSAHPEGARPDTNSPAPTMTRTGTLVGTPLYMSPEQFAGAHADARSDQFSFCVALHLALHGQHPFEGDDTDALSAAVRQGRRRALPAGTRGQVPPHVQRALGRGLAIDPTQRFPTMDALCDALRGRQRRPIVIGLLVVLIAVVSVVLVAVLTDRRLGPAAAGGALCEGAERRIVGIWDDQRKATMRAHFATTGVPTASLTVFEREVDAYLARWLAVHDSTCKATYAAGAQSQQVFETQFRCLHRQLAELEATVAVAAEADIAPTSLPWMISTLPSADACVDVNRLLASWERARPAAAQDVEDKLAQALVLQRAADLPAALRLAREAVDAAAVLGDKHLVVAAQLRLGTIEAHTGDLLAGERTLRRALTAAEAGAADEYLAELWFERSSAASALGWYREALDHVEHAFAWMARTAPEEHLRANLFHQRSVILDAMGRFEEAELNSRLALSIRQSQPGGTSLAVAASLNMIGSSMLGRGRLDEALDHFQQALALREAALGPNHSRVAGTLNNIGQVWTAMGRTDEAAAVLARALAIRRARGTDDLEVALVLDSLGRLARATGDLDGALAHHRRSRELHEQALGPTHPRLAACHGFIADVLAGQGQPAQALAAYHRAIDLIERAAGTDSPALVEPLTGAGLALLALGSAIEAAPLLERALGLGESGSSSRATRARVRFALARALVASGRGRDRGQDLAREARQLHAEAGPRHLGELSTIDTWLSSHGSAPSSP